MCRYTQVYMLVRTDIWCMKTVQVSKTVRNMIEDYKEDGESIDKAINRLIDSSDPLEFEDKGKTNVRVNEATLKRLKRYKSYPLQSHSDTIKGLLDSVR